MRSWLVAGLAAVLAVAVSAGVLIFGNPTRHEIEVYAVAHDISAGTTLTPDALCVVAVMLPSGASTLFQKGAGDVRGLRAAHDLIAGQLLQLSDVVSSSAPADIRLVFIPVKVAPPVSAGAKIDLLVISGTADNPAVLPFALGIEVRGVVPGGFIVAVTSRQAPAFVYAAEAMRLVAVIGARGAPAGKEQPVSAPNQALAMASQP
ncbi:MAG TPA: SAF domain-containing protein [Candidatus Dormibacteraeota bacterium]|nr:SAF domain-containing protein [Candidatus Dormibacteraeota bacterium]